MHVPLGRLPCFCSMDGLVQSIGRHWWFISQCHQRWITERENAQKRDPKKDADAFHAGNRSDLAQCRPILCSYGERYQKGMIAININILYTAPRQAPEEPNCRTATGLLALVANGHLTPSGSGCFVITAPRVRTRGYSYSAPSGAGQCCRFRIFRRVQKSERRPHPIQFAYFRFATGGCVS